MADPAENEPIRTEHLQSDSGHLYEKGCFSNDPSDQPREIPQILLSQLVEAGENVFNLNDKWKIKEANGQTRGRTFYYSYHPGHQLRLNMDHTYAVSDYERWTNYETAETGVRYTDKEGEWIRRSFTSREDNVSITEIKQSSLGNKINMTIAIDDISGMYKAYDNMSKVTISATPQIIR